MALKEKLQEYALIAEIISAIAIVGSLIFVGLELSQSNELMESDARANWVNMVGSSNASISQDKELATIFLKDRNGEALTDLESLMMYTFWAKAIDINHLAFRDLPSLDLGVQELNIKANFGRFPSFRGTWQDRKTRYPSDFIAWMDGLANAP